MAPMQGECLFPNLGARPHYPLILFSRSANRMSVIPLTLTISLCLVFTFVLFFLREHSRHRFSSAESDALMPLADETPRLANTAKSSARARAVVAPAHHHHHDDSGSCGCRDGTRPPCAGCLHANHDHHADEAHSSSSSSR
jgi:hypothetical protein